MRAALIGLFGFGTKLAAALAKIEGAKLAYGYHPDPQRARAWDPERGLSDLSTILSDRQLEAVLIASPTPRHVEHLLACVEAGKSVFVEKPLVSTYAECEQVTQACAAHPVPVVMVGHNFRRMGWARAIKRLLDEGRLGRLVDIEMNASHGGAFNFGMANWRGHRRWHREGPMNSLGVHLIDLLHEWVGPVRHVYASIRNLADVTEAPDTSAALLELDAGVTALLKNNYIVPSEQRVVVTGTEGIVTWTRGDLSLRIGRDVERVASHPEPVPWTVVDTMGEELREFCHAVADPTNAVETGLAVGVAAVSVLEACYRSATEHRSVSLEECPLYAAAMNRWSSKSSTSVPQPQAQ